MKIEDAWAPADPLGEALQFLRMTGTFYSRAELTAPWGIALPAMPGCLLFHCVTAGEVLLEVGDKKHRLHRGDLVLMPRGEGHLLLSKPSARTLPLFDLPRVVSRERYEVIRHGGGGELTTLICGAVRFDHPAASHLIRLMPPLILIKAESSPHVEWVNSMLRFMAAEASELRPGGEAVMTRLADILLIQILRAWIEQDGSATTGWLGALQDRQIGRALARIHRDPARAWSLDTLAQVAGMSRSALAARFTALVGEPAMTYVARWRMQVALTWLREDDMTLAAMAERLGYQSEAAFSRAFKRFMNRSPGAVRRETRQSRARQPLLPAGAPDGAARPRRPSAPGRKAGAQARAVAASVHSF
jgi:AraC-like DNA-binding protein